MDRTLIFKLLAVATGASFLALPGFAQSSAAPAPAAKSNGSPVFAPKSEEKDEASAPRRRAVSSSVAAALAAASPKYEPPPPKPEPKPEEELPDMREIDKPKNRIIRLPKYIVQEDKPPVFTERAITTDKGLADIAVRRFISDMDHALNRFTLPLFGTSKEARALAMYAEEERLQNMAYLRDAADTASKSDPAAGAYIRREAEETFMRTSDFGWQGGDPK